MSESVMAEESIKEELVDTLRRERAEWDALIARVGLERLDVAGVAGAWTTRDVVAHVTWTERETVGILRARALVGSDLWNLPLEERNAVIFEQNRHRPSREVLAEAAAVFQDLLAAIDALSEEDLTDPARFRGFPPDWVPWRVVAINTYHHYEHHAPGIQAWLETQGD